MDRAPVRHWGSADFRTAGLAWVTGALADRLAAER